MGSMFSVFKLELSLFTFYTTLFTFYRTLSFDILHDFIYVLKKHTMQLLNFRAGAIDNCQGGQLTTKVVIRVDSCQWRPVIF